MAALVAIAGSILALLSQGIGSIKDFLVVAYSFFHSILGKFLLLFIIALFWVNFVQEYATPFLRIIQNINNQLLYPLLSQSTLQFTYDVLITFSTYKIFMWLVAPNAINEARQLSSENHIADVERRFAGVPMTHAGFSSQRIK